MKITRITFLRVPFDNSYKNVFSYIQEDGSFATDLNHRDYLKYHYTQNYPKIVLQFDNGQLRSIRRDELYCELNFRTDRNLFNYNYAIIEDYSRQEETRYTETSFWFINRISENNSQNERNYFLRLELDVWSTHQDLVYTEKRKQLVDTMHINQLEKNSEGVISPFWDLNVYPNQQTNLDYMEVYNDEDKYNILWANVKVRPNCHYQAYTQGNPTGVRIDSLSDWNSNVFIYSSSVYHEFFYPIAVYKGEWYRPVPIINCDFVDSMGEYLINLNDGKARFGSEDIVSVRYTFYIPSTVATYVGDDGRITFQVRRALSCLVFNNNNDLVVSNVFGFEPGFKNNVGVGFQVYDLKAEKPYTPFSADETDFDSSGSIDYRQLIKTTPLLHRYPFEKITLSFGGVHTYDIMGKKYDESLYVECIPSCDGVKYYTTGGVSGLLYYNSRGTPLLVDTTTSLPVSYSQYDSYIRNNGERLSVAKQEQLATAELKFKYNALSAGEKVITGASEMIIGSAETVGGAIAGQPSAGGMKSVYSGAITTAFGVAEGLLHKKSYEKEKHFIEANYAALISDVASMKDVSATPQSGENDTVYQDRFECHRYKIDGFKMTQNNFDALTKIHLYGFKIEEYRMLTDFCMTNFVFVKTRDASLTSEINLVVKSKLESILNGGVRCWNITSTNPLVKEMNYDCANYQNTKYLPIINHDIGYG